MYFYDNGLCLDFWHFLDINDWLVLGWQTFDKLEKQTKIFSVFRQPDFGYCEISDSFQEQQHG